MLEAVEESVWLAPLFKLLCSLRFSNCILFLIELAAASASAFRATANVEATALSIKRKADDMESESDGGELLVLIEGLIDGEIGVCVDVEPDEDINSGDWHCCSIPKIGENRPPLPLLGGESDEGVVTATVLVGKELPTDVVFATAFTLTWGSDEGDCEETLTAVGVAERRVKVKGGSKVVTVDVGGVEMDEDEEEEEEEVEAVETESGGLDGEGVDDEEVEVE
jgi:hypothetical protein